MSRRAVALLGALAVAAACTGGGSASPSPSPSSGLRVPDVVGMPLGSAVQTLGRAGFQVDDRLRAYVAPSPIDHVLRQWPTSGTTVDNPPAMTLTLSAGPHPQSTSYSVGTCDLLYPPLSPGPCTGGIITVPVFRHASGPVVVHTKATFAPCRADQLRAGHEHASVGTAIINPITFRNVGPRSCTLNGYPTSLTALTAQGSHELTLHRRPLRFVGSIQPANLPGTNTAHLYVLTTRTTGLEPGVCPRANWHSFNHLAIHLANGGVVTAQIPLLLPCGWNVEVTPFAIPLRSR